ncbi:MAG: RibD family protein [Rhizonema sp. PD37]|nr:RibD family protein [Rhizonema sp. PD37]
MVQRLPNTTAVLAMSVDGKIADVTRVKARFSSQADAAHLEKQIALADAILFGAGTLRAYGTTLRVSDPKLLQQRKQAGQPPQPLNIVVTHSGKLNPECRFFQQPVPRWLVTTTAGSLYWQERQQTRTSTGINTCDSLQEFERILVFETNATTVDLNRTLQHLTTMGIARLAVLGGGTLIASMLEADLIDEFWLTVCPLILGGSTAPSPVDGKGFLAQLAPRLQLLEVHTVEQEVFLHYRRQRSGD